MQQVFRRVTAQSTLQTREGLVYCSAVVLEFQVTIVIIAKNPVGGRAQGQAVLSSLRKSEIEVGVSVAGEMVKLGLLVAQVG